jgi:hypothetical protein
MNGEDRPKRDVAGLLVAVLVLLVIVVHPMTSWGIPLGWLGRLLGFSEKIVEKAPRFTPDDVFIWLAGALLVLRMILRRDFGVLRSLPVAGVVLVVLTALSMLFAENKLTAIAGVVQYVEYFIVFYLAVACALGTKERLRLAVLLWLLVGSGVILWGLIDYLSAGCDAVHVSGPFQSRNDLSGYLAMLLPFAWGLMLHSRKWGAAVQAVVLAALGLVVMVAGGPWLAALIGMAVITFARSPKLFPLFALGVLALVLAVFPALPRDNARILTTSVYPFDETQREATANEAAPGFQVLSPLGFFEARRLSPRYLEWQAAMKFLTPSAYQDLGMSRAEHTRRLLLGVGIGNYQLNIGRYYGFLPKPNANLTEPYTNNLYLVLAMSVGLPAALAFVWLVGTFIRRAVTARRETSDDFLRGVFLGGAGALVGLLVASIFTQTVVHGSGPAMVLVFGFIAAGTRLVERTSVEAR